MPWASKKQAAWGHSSTGLKALGGTAKVKEWDAATPKGSLSESKPDNWNSWKPAQSSTDQPGSILRSKKK